MRGSLHDRGMQRSVQGMQGGFSMGVLPRCTHSAPGDQRASACGRATGIAHHRWCGWMQGDRALRTGCWA
eukprot:7330963-Prymnesium_polylepis.1